MACEFLSDRQGHALGLVRDGLLLGPVRGGDASAQVVQGIIRSVNLEGANRCCARGLLGRGGHVRLLGFGTHQVSSTWLARDNPWSATQSAPTDPKATEVHLVGVPPPVHVDVIPITAKRNPVISPA